MGTGLGTGHLLQRTMPTEQKFNNVVWFTTNLRIEDNKALSKAMEAPGLVGAVFCIHQAWFNTNWLGFPKMHRYRAQFLLESLNDLSRSLAELHIPFTVLLGNPEIELPNYLSKHQAKNVYLQRDWTSEEQQTLERVQKQASSEIQWELFYDQFLIHPSDIPFDIDQLPFQFTQFRKTVEKNLYIQPVLSDIQPQSIENFTQNPIPTLEDLGLESFNVDPRSAFPFKGGASVAQKRLNTYFWETNAIQSYKETRNGLIGTSYSSKFSPWLSQGCISPKMIYHQLKAYESEQGANSSTYWLIFELLWRDFFKYLSLKHGNRIFQRDGIGKKKKTWNQDMERFQQWCAGETESEFVNANMEELNKTGWMSNRGRQNVASYLAKTMKIDWRWGAAYFESLLIDYDVHSNYGNWMYVAGVGNDPRDRIFKVDKQAEYYDPEGTFTKRWLSQTSIA